MASSDRSADVADFFSQRATDYESQARRGLPRRDEMLGELVRCLPADAHDVLELGCGAGALTLMLADRYPEARLTAVDASPEMLKVARGRLEASVAGAGERVRFVESHFERFDAGAAGFDLVTASMSLHHVADKAPLYRRLHAALRPGGYLIFADELTGAVEHVARLHREDWLAFAAQPGRLTSEEIEATLAHERDFDHYETLPRQLELLREAGFAAVDCAWRYWNYAVFAAARS